MIKKKMKMMEEVELMYVKVVKVVVMKCYVSVLLLCMEKCYKKRILIDYFILKRIVFY